MSETDASSSTGWPTMDAHGLLEAFGRARARAETETSPRARTEAVLEAAAYAVALEVVGRLSSVDRSDREALASRARRTLLSLAGLAQDEDERDALDVAARYAREGLRMLSGLPPLGAPLGASESKNEAPALPPPPVQALVKMLRGELDGFASADLALQLRASPRGHAELARLVPSMMPMGASRLRVAADTLSVEGVAMRDPAEGRLVATLELGESGEGMAAFEAIVFADGTLAIYADPPSAMRVTSAAIVVAAAGPGYVEVGPVDGEAALTLHVEHGDRAFDWPLTFREPSSR